MTATVERVVPRPVAGPVTAERAGWPVPARSRSHGWRVAGSLLLALVMIGATAGILLVAKHNSVLLGRMTTDVATAQQRASNLANAQRQTLQLLGEVTALDPGGDSRDVVEDASLLSRQLAIAEVLFPTGSDQRHELAELRTAIDGFAWPRLSDWGNGGVLRVSAVALAHYADLRIKDLYTQQEKLFYQATLDSVQAKRQSERAFTGLVLLVVLLGMCWVVLLKRRSRSDLARANDRLRHQAYHDALTGLPNRTLLMSRLTEVVSHARQVDGTVTAVLVDLDGFKKVNDTLGHQGGDELLQRVAERLRGCVLGQDMVARLGGDEFAIVLPGGTAEHGDAVGRRVLDALHRPIGAAGQETRTGASVGVAQLDGHQTAEELLADADMAMYAAKRAGRGRVLRFEPAMRETSLQRGRMEQQLARAVGRGQIEVHYQPVVDLATLRVTSVEALARWRRPDGELIPPCVFIPLAEESGLIREIGTEVLRQACRTVRGWRAAVPGAAGLGALAETGLPPDALILEITESVLLEDSAGLTAELDRLQALRVRLAIDDFGAGYSSLSSLRRFPVDTLKIDRMFLDLRTGNAAPLVGAVAELGRSLGLTVVAEGIETAEQLAVVRAARCDAVQGYLVSRPLPEADARLFLEWAATSDEIASLLRD
jgi:diguanylate cyclase (GGDEF)-like protein